MKLKNKEETDMNIIRISWNRQQKKRYKQYAIPTNRYKQYNNITKTKAI